MHDFLSSIHYNGWVLPALLAIPLVGALVLIVMASTANDDGTLEVSDHGRLDNPLAGRQRPKPLQIGGRGLWIVNQFCSLVQVRSLKEGTVVRAHVPRNAEAAR